MSVSLPHTGNMMIRSVCHYNSGISQLLEAVKCALQDGRFLKEKKWRGLSLPITVLILIQHRLPRQRILSARD